MFRLMREFRVRLRGPIHQTGDDLSITPDWQSRLRIDRKIVSGTYSKKYPDWAVWFCEPDNCTSPQVVQNVYLSLNITVPQTCSINAGQTVIVGFREYINRSI